jgi:hypothetical protein
MTNSWSGCLLEYSGRFSYKKRPHPDAERLRPDLNLQTFCSSDLLARPKNVRVMLERESNRVVRA